MTTMNNSALAQSPWSDGPRTAHACPTDASWSGHPTDPSSPVSLHGIVGGSLALRRVIRMVEAVAATDAAILIRGETGTGKELIASLIHTLSSRRGRPFI